MNLLLASCCCDGIAGGCDCLDDTAGAVVSFSGACTPTDPLGGPSGGTWPVSVSHVGGDCLCRYRYYEIGGVWFLDIIHDTENETWAAYAWYGFLDGVYGDVDDDPVMCETTYTDYKDITGDVNCLADGSLSGSFTLDGLNKNIDCSGTTMTVTLG